MLRFNRYDRESEYRKDQIRPWIDTDVEKTLCPFTISCLPFTMPVQTLNRTTIVTIRWRRSRKRLPENPLRDRGQNHSLVPLEDGQLFEYFNAYGTDPILSLVNSFFWILGFAVIYIVFPSEEDNLRFHPTSARPSQNMWPFFRTAKQFFTADEIYKGELRTSENETAFKKTWSAAAIYRLSGCLSIISVFVHTNQAPACAAVSKFNIYQDWSQLNQ